MTKTVVFVTHKFGSFWTYFSYVFNTRLIGVMSKTNHLSKKKTVAGVFTFTAWSQAVEGFSKTKNGELKIWNGV